MSHDLKKEFEDSFKGYHKDAPAHLRKESALLKKSVASKMTHKTKKPYYTRADGTHETKAQYNKRHVDDLRKYESN